ncbi:MAG: hypothetical protein JWM78_2344 [Verrucomicrobiaceae bacterium]|nr:hypothetical protein [Verrucomicrobiaceae bacterium]
MNNSSCAHDEDIVVLFDSAICALRADPSFWQCSFDAAFIRLLAAGSILNVAAIELWQLQENRQQRLLRYAYPPLIVPLVCDSRALTTPIMVAGTQWGELIMNRVAPASWSFAEARCAAALADLATQLLMLFNAKHTEQRFQALAQNAPVAILQTDEDRHVIYRNEQFVQMFGYDYADLSKLVLSHLLSSDDDRTLEEDSQTLDRMGQIQRTYRVKHRDGSERHMLWHVVTENKDVNAPGVSGRVGIGIDITALWQAQQQLLVLTTQQRAILDNAAHGILATDATGVITLFNPAAEKMLGYSAAEVISRSPHIFHRPQDIAAVHNELKRNNFSPDLSGFVDQANYSGKEIEWVYVHKDGTEIPVLISTTALRNHNGDAFGYMGMITDLRERNRFAAAEAREQAWIKHINRGINTAIGEQFFDQLISELRRALNVSYLNLLELSPNCKTPQGRCLTATASGIQIDTVEFTNSVLLEVMSTGKKLHVRDVAAKYPLDHYAQLLGIYEVVAVPLIASNGSILGALVAAHEQILPEPQLIEHLLEIFAVRASSELERLRNERDQRAREAEQYWLYTASERIHACHDVAGVAKEATTALANHYSAPRVSLALNEGTTYRILAYVGAADKGPKHKVYPRAPMMYGGVIAAKNSILLVPNFLDKGREEKIIREYTDRDMRSVAIIGLIDNGHDIGAITLEYSDPNALDQLDLDVLGTFGRAVTLALGRAQHREKLEYQASHDALTGLYNRSTLHKAFKKWHEAGGTSTALLLLDLDRFKEVNDTLGHHVGDALLLQVGARLRTGLNYRKAVLTRLGGDEFAVLLLDKTITQNRAYSLAKNIQLAIRKPFLVNGVNLEISASIGVGIYPEDGIDSHALLRSADVAMYEAKRSGSGVALYERSLDLNSPERLALISDLNSGIRKRELTLFYQPKIDLHSGAVVGFEGLLRWQHPQLGLLMPAHLLPLVEMSDAIHDLTRMVIEEACAQLRTWIAAGENWCIAINLSARNLIDDRIVRYLAEMMQSYHIPRGRLELEITETALIKDPQHALQLLERIATLGIALSIDDFGTGYSSLVYLRQMPISTLKIDHTFVRDMANNEQDALIVRSIVQLAHSLDLKVIAEGVETEATLLRLRELNCDQAQGFYFTPALPIADLTQWLTNRQN